jgi:hypothetical protein
LPVLSRETAIEEQPAVLSKARVERARRKRQKNISLSIPNFEQREHTYLPVLSRETDMYSVIGTLNKAQAERVERRGRTISSMFWILSREARYICHFKQRDRH